MATPAEARRERILAKKTARMAYASNTATLKPSASLPEPVQPPPRSSSATSSSKSAPTSASSASARTSSPSQRLTLPEPTRSQRLFLAAVLALVSAWSMATGISSSLSGVALFLQAEAALNAMGILRMAGMGKKLLCGGQGLFAGMMSVAPYAPAFLEKVRCVYEDATVFGFLYLVGIRVVQAWLPLDEITGTH